MTRKYFGNADTWDGYYERCSSYEEVATICRISAQDVREAILNEIESISWKIESERKEIAVWADYEPKTEFFKLKAPEALGYALGTYFALQEEFAAVNRPRLKLEGFYDRDGMRK